MLDRFAMIIRRANRACLIAFALVAGAFVGPPIASAEDSAGEPPRSQVGPVQRTTIVVRDMDAALRFFRDILGLEIRRDLPLSGPAVSRLLGHEAIEGRIVILQSGDHEIANIALLTYTNLAAEAEPERSKLFGFGDVALIMETDRIDEIRTLAEEAGYPAITDPIVIFERPGWKRQSRELIIIGPEGIGVNLIEPGKPG